MYLHSHCLHRPQEWFGTASMEAGQWVLSVALLNSWVSASDAAYRWPVSHVSPSSPVSAQLGQFIGVPLLSAGRGFLAGILALHLGISSLSLMVGTSHLGFIKALHTSFATHFFL